MEVISCPSAASRSVSNRARRATRARPRCQPSPSSARKISSRADRKTARFAGKVLARSADARRCRQHIGHAVDATDDEIRDEFGILTLYVSPYAAQISFRKRHEDDPPIAQVDRPSAAPPRAGEEFLERLERGAFAFFHLEHRGAKLPSDRGMVFPKVAFHILFADVAFDDQRETALRLAHVLVHAGKPTTRGGRASPDHPTLVVAALLLRLVGLARVGFAIGRAGLGLAAAEVELVLGRVADRPAAHAVVDGEH